MAAAITVNVILLVAILTAVLIYQLITIGVLSGQRRELESKVNEYTEKLEQGEKDLEYLKSEQFLLDEALKLGYYFPED